MSKIFPPTVQLSTVRSFFSYDLNKWTSFSGFLGQRLNNLQPGYTFEIILRHCFNMTKFLPNLVNSRNWLFSMNNNYIWAHVYGWNIEDIFYLIPQNTFTFKNVGWNFFGNNLTYLPCHVGNGLQLLCPLIKKKNETEFEYEVKISLKAVICFFLVLQAMLVW